MKRLAVLIVSFIVAGTVAFAHGDNDHVRGVVTQISGKSITVQVPGKAAKTVTLALTDKTTFEKSGAPAQVSDLKVGERVIIDVPKGTSEAHSIRFGAAAKQQAQKPKHSS